MRWLPAALLVLTACSTGFGAPAVANRSTHSSPVAWGKSILNATEPVWPAAAIAGEYPHLGRRCDPAPPAAGDVDVDPQLLKAANMPVNPTELAQFSSSVVIAKAVHQRAYWRRAGVNDDPVLTDSEAALAGGNWTDDTATNLQVIRTLKGPGLGWVQTDQFGNWWNTTACPGMVTIFSNSQPMKVGTVYIVFDEKVWSHPGHEDNHVVVTSPTATWFTAPWIRFILADGIVHSEAEQGQAAMPIAPMRLDEFLRVTHLG